MYSNPESGPAKPAIRDAATVILMKEGRAPFEVFLMRRHRGQSFMAGAYVFPGGRLDECDCSQETCRRVRGLDGVRARELLQEPELSGIKVLGLFLCAVRELFEEAGVLLAYDSAGKLLRLDDEQNGPRLSKARLRLHRGEIDLCGLAEEEGLHYALDRLLPYSHWITPAIEKKRFDTRFFLARLPADQSPSHDEVELVSSVWMTPRQALTEHEQAKLKLMPPTLKTLEELSEYESRDQLFSLAREFTIAPILPQGVKTEHGFGVLLPHDPEYAIAGYKQTPRPGETSRLILKEGKWTSARCESER